MSKRRFIALQKQNDYQAPGRIVFGPNSMLANRIWAKGYMGESYLGQRVYGRVVFGPKGIWAGRVGAKGYMGGSCLGQRVYGPIVFGSKGIWANTVYGAIEMRAH